MLPEVARPARRATLVAAPKTAELRQAYRATVERLQRPLDRCGYAGIERVTIAKAGVAVTDEHIVDAVRRAVNLCSVLNHGPLVMWKGKLAELSWNRLEDAPEIRVIKTARALADFLRRKKIVFIGHVPALLGAFVGDDIYWPHEINLSSDTRQTALDTQIWGEVPTLHAIQAMPVMRAGGDWIEEPGFDERAGLWVMPPELPAGDQRPRTLVEALAELAKRGGVTGTASDFGKALGWPGSPHALAVELRHAIAPLAATSISLRQDGRTHGRTRWVLKSAHPAHPEIA
jgi:hypothetical protein